MPELTPPNQITDFKLEASYWYVTHKLLLKKILIIFLIVLSLILYSFSLYRLLLILVVQDPILKQNLNQLPNDLVDYEYFRQVNRASPLEILDFAALASDSGRNDFAAKIRNPNDNFFAYQVKLDLISGAEIIDQKTVFILPGEEKYLAFFGVENRDVSPTLKISEVNWRRVRGFAEFASDRFKFQTSEIKFENLDSQTRGNLPVSALKFKITNQSAYNFWQVGVFMVLFSGDQIVGANYLALDQFKSGETRAVEMRWPESFYNVSRVEILPEVNILDSSVYMPVE